MKTRNFSIIAHIDHGKSTLADRFLEITNTIPADKISPQHLDQLELERERGITIKLAPVSMNFKDFQLNLIDTPGHVDFSYEVSRSLACVEGVVLLVDATKGIEAQTLSNFLLASEQNLVIIPAINKIDMENSQVDEVEKQMISSLGFSKEEIHRISAKTGQGVEQLLDRIVERIPYPKGNVQEPLKALLFDSVYDQFKGVVAYTRLFDGQVKKGDRLKLVGAGEEFEAVSVGIFAPKLVEKEDLEAGGIGWVATGLKEVQKVRVGDTLTQADSLSSALPGYKESKPMVFAGIFPVDRDAFPRLKEALEKLKLNDAALTYESENSPALGFGVRAGFLGLLHMEIVQERLEREFDIELILSSPTVRYRVTKNNGVEIEVSNPQELPTPNETRQILEPWVDYSIVTTQTYVGSITQLLHSHRAKVANVEYFGDKVKITGELPLSEIVSQFYDQLKSVSSGFASFDYELSDYRAVEAVRLDILVAREPVDALSQIVVKEKAYPMGKALVEKLKESIPRQQFEVALQASIGGKIISAERIPPFRKDVTAKLYGGDRTRKDKLLDKQKKGKQRMKRVGKVDIPQEAFLSVLKI
jgi:GTP-binding protein LepA